ncbi:hypothetical protein Tco_1547184 [Tanacetum coccineum]
MANLPPNHNEFALAAEAAPNNMNGWIEEEEDPEMEEEEDPEEDPLELVYLTTASIILLLCVGFRSARLITSGSVATIFLALLDVASELLCPKPSLCDKQTSNLRHNDLGEYEWKMSYEEGKKIYAEAVIFINKRLVRLVDVTMEQWLDLKYGNHMTMNENVKKGLASKFYNHLDMDYYTKNALWIYWARGDDEVELSDEESSNPDDENLIDKDEVVEIFRIKTNNGHSEWPTYSWKDDGYRNGKNLPRAYIVGNILRYQDLEWYEALKDGKLKDEALKNKAIMEGIINEDDESNNEVWRRWDD